MTCTEAQLAVAKKYRLAHKEEISNYMKNWRANNKDKVKKYNVKHKPAQEKWKSENKDHISETARTYRINHLERKKETDEAWRLRNPERVKEISVKSGKKYRENNKEKRKETQRKYYSNNTEKINASNDKWRKENPERRKEISRNSARKHYDKDKSTKWRRENPEAAKVIANRHQAKRRRNLGYIPLNTKFHNSVGHHIDNMHVLYIPEELHKSISHSQGDKESMTIINKAAFDYIEGGI